MRKIIYILFCSVFAISSYTQAQTGQIKFTSLSTRDGLLSNAVNTILKDRYGIMWFGTDDGLNKFDGTNFTVYRYMPGDSTSLRTNEVLALHEDPSGNLWIGTSGGGLSLYDRKKDHFLHYPVQSGSTTLTGSDVIRSICSDYRGKIWIAQFEGLYVMDPQSQSISKHTLTDEKGTPIITTLIAVYADSKKNLWIASENGLLQYAITTNTLKVYENDKTDPSSLPDNRVRAVTEDKWGNIWVGTATGLCKLKPDGSGFTRSFLNNPEITSIAADGEGLLWVGCSNGLYVYNIEKDTYSLFTQDFRNHQSLCSKGVRCVYIDQQGIYWLGTYQGGICKYDKNLNLFNLTLNSCFQENRNHVAVLTALAENKNGNVLLGTDGNGLYELNREKDQAHPVNLSLKHVEGNSLSILALLRSTNDKLYIGTYSHGLIILDQRTGECKQLVKGNGVNDLTNNDIFSLFEDSKGNIWIGTNGDGVVVVQGSRVIARYSPLARNGESLMPINGYIRAIGEDAEGNIWIGTHGGGVALLNTSSGKWKIYTQENSLLPSNKIQSLHRDKKGKMWIGTFSGLAAYIPDNQQFKLYTEKDGLQNAMIYQIVEDGTGKLWLSTNTGISRLDTATESFWNFTHMNGLQNSNFVRAAGLELSDGELFFGGLEGFNHFYPNQLKVNRNVPRVILTDLRISNKSVPPGNDAPIKEHISTAGEIHLNYKQNFALSFVALNYTIPRQNSYAYKLDGFDKDWNYIGPGNTASYTNLDPGEYTFRVKAANNDGIWSTTDTTIKVFVKPPFWRTAYAYIFYILAIGGTLLYIRHRGISRLRRKFAQEQEQQEIERTRQLEQMKLKFLTNLSHDFRTPISLIMGPVDQLIDGEDKPEKQEKLNMVRRNARRLLNLVNQLLDFRKLEEQELKLQLSKGEFISFLKEVTDSFRDMSERKNIQFTLKTCIDRLDAYFDRDKMERIFFNLLSNAFKFTLAGGRITVDLQKTESADDPEYTWVSISVTDTGIGIPEDKKELIFDRFFQNESSAAVLNQGSGIGLSITKEFIELHNGRIRVESEPGKGCSFIVKIPLKRAYETASILPAPVPEETVEEKPQEDPAVLRENSNISHEPSLLLVEDNEDFRDYLKDNLRHQYKILEAVNGKDGWQKTLSNHPQLILTDISMPEMDGIELVNKLKSDKRTCHIPVILLTAMTGQEQQLKGLETGANDYITKPFNLEVLNAKIRNLLHLKDTMKNTYSKQISVASPEVEMESPDAKLLAEIVNYLENNLTNPQLSVENLSKHIGMSRGTLYARLLQLSGETPVEYIRSFRLNKAITLMEKRNMTISETAYEVGFTTPNYFTRSFKEKFDMLPSEYIAKIKKAKAGSKNEIPTNIEDNGRQ
ncbi:hybrid sensor histidine kinase/response regulator transcription factor [Pseudoflavitalea rhizosphaerae]|uniref:hybrid sensor histidine kinase/response regulator transcription factor n=1 Tax=Pseudoflavitalea rhizosphaerae TaxID=1884793 RepID=UPI000F8DFAA2|nr:hybrid sensor histidine kinase/response regulator transcription factor [Pseudoflavitalea rhizosphaerae]